MVGAFDVPFGHLAFDDAGCGADPSGGVESAEQPGQETLPEAVVGVGVLRGESALVGEGLAGDPQCGDEADSVGVVAGVGGGVGHQGADRVVTAQVSPDFLEHQGGRFGAQHGAGPALVGL